MELPLLFTRIHVDAFPLNKRNSGSIEHRHFTIQNPPVKRTLYYIYLGESTVLAKGQGQSGAQSAFTPSLSSGPLYSSGAFRMIAA
jgi:hypothetical protein